MEHIVFFKNLCKTHICKQKTLLITSIAFGCIYSITSGFGIPILFEKVFKSIFETRDEYPFCIIISISLLIPISFAVRGLFGYLSTIFMSKCSLRLITDLRLDILSKLQKLPLDFFEKHDTSDIFHRIMAEPQVLQNILIDVVVESIKQSIQVIAGFIGLFYLSFKYCDIFIILIFIIFTPLIFLPIRILGRSVKKYSKLSQQNEAKLFANITENLRLVKEIRLFNLKDNEIGKILIKMNNYINVVYKMICRKKIQQPFVEVVSAIIISVLFLYAFLKKIPFSAFSSMGIAFYFSFDAIKRLLINVGTLQQSVGSLERIMYILQQQPSTIETSDKASYNGKCKGEIVFKNVCFRYENSKKNSLNDVSVTINSKKCYAIIGFSGSGKSTFTKLLTRLYDVSSGSILIDEINIKKWNIECLRKQISVVPQTSMLFNDTFSENIKVGKLSATKNEIITATKMAYAHDFIIDKGGYNTIIGENGNQFSGGQRQRLAIARAFLKESPILIFDEATSSLDAESENLIKKSLELVRNKKTLIIIAHHISTIQNADCILFLDNGNLVAQGTHEFLLNKNEAYRKLVKKQQIENGQNNIN